LKIFKKFKKKPQPTLNYNKYITNDSSFLKIS
jgi:hypothetical protein